MQPLGVSGKERKMSVTSEDFIQLIYDLVNGALNTEDFLIPESEFVKNEYEDGKFCSEKYSEVLESYLRLCKRLNVREMDDNDVELIINNFMDITEHIGKKMFEYGVFFARREMQNPDPNKSVTE